VFEFGMFGQVWTNVDRFVLEKNVIYL
jgi:hypothetical protein